MIVLGFCVNYDAIWGQANTAWEEKFAPGESGENLQTLYRTIGCDTVDAVDIGKGITMWVDDEGLLKSKSKINHLASALRTLYWANSISYTVPALYPPVAGVAVLLGTDEEGKCIDLTPEQVEYVRSLFPVAKAKGE